MYLYDKIKDGLISLQAMSTHALLQLCAETEDVRVKDMIGDIIMYERN